MVEDWFRRFKRALSKHGPVPRDASERTFAMDVLKGTITGETQQPSGILGAWLLKAFPGDA
jgi:hypothetical protein